MESFCLKKPSGALGFLKKEKRVYLKILIQLTENHQSGTPRYDEVTAYLKALDKAMNYYDKQGNTYEG